MKLYKLTTQDGYTKNHTKWEEGTTLIKSPRNNPELCSNQVFHAYKNINLAFLLNPIHADIEDPLLWKCVGDVCVEDFGKVGTFSLHIKKQLSTPKWVNSNKEQDVRIVFAILCAESVLSVFEDKYPQDNRPRLAIQAAKYYLQNKNNAADAARAADAAAYAAAYAADAAAYAAAYAADAAADAAAYAAAYAAAAYATDVAADAAYAADAAAYAAAYAAAAYATDVAADAAYAADAAAYAAAYAADAAADAAARAADAADAAAEIDFCKLADKAVKMILG
jgi:hypothetical protein